MSKLSKKQIKETKEIFAEAYHLYVEGKYQESLEKYQEVLSLVEPTDNSASDDFAAKVTVYIAMGNVYSKLGDESSAEEFFRKEFKLQQQVGSEAYYFQPFTEAYRLYIEGKYQESLEKYQEVLSLVEPTNDLVAKVTVYIAIADIYSKLGDESSAEEFFRKEFELQQQVEPKATIRPLFLSPEPTPVQPRPRPRPRPRPSR